MKRFGRFLDLVISLLLVITGALFCTSVVLIVENWLVWEVQFDKTLSYVLAVGFGLFLCLNIILRTVARCKQNEEIYYENKEREMANILIDEFNKGERK